MIHNIIITKRILDEFDFITPEKCNIKGCNNNSELRHRTLSIGLCFECYYIFEREININKKKQVIIK